MTQTLRKLLDGMDDMSDSSTWPGYVARRYDVLRLFSEPPSLKRVYLLEASLEENGPSLRMRFDLRDYPAVPPKAWVDAGYNTVQVMLSFVGLTTISLVGFSLENCVDIEFKLVDKLIEFDVSGTTHISGKAIGVMVNKVSAYLRVQRSQPAPFA